MSMLFWNVRGMNKKSRRNDIKHHIKYFCPSMVGLIETKLKSHKSFRITRCMPVSWSYCNNYSFSNRGRIWLAWDENIWSGSVLYVSLQQITVEIKNRGGLSIILTVIYGENRVIERTVLWTDIKQIYDTYQDAP